MNGTRQGDNAASAYRVVGGIGAATEDYMKMALDAARIQLLRAEAAMAAGEIEVKAKALSSAGSIVEFMLGLSGSAPGPLSDCLASVYQYVLAAILKGNAGNDTEAVSAARVALEELTATWRRIFPDVIAWEEGEMDPAASGRPEHA